jgi:ribosomal protein S18 acetylase RimI-like enzyme
MVAFPSSALSLLGRGAVRRYYNWQFEGPHDLAAIGAFSGGNMVGFCLGGVFRGSLRGFLKRHRLFLIWTLLKRPALLRNELIRSRLAFVRSARHRLAGPRTNHRSAGAPLRSFAILSIAVTPSARRTGVGRRLITEMEKRAAAVGFDGMHLTVHPENRTAIDFYHRIGWKEQELSDNSVRMVKTVSRN